MPEETLVKADKVCKYFPVSRGIFGLRRVWLKAVDSVSLEISKGEVLGLVGESGSGKSTLGRMLAGLLRPTSGAVYYRGRELQGSWLRKVRRRIQLIFQNPDASLDPRMRILDILKEALEAGGYSDRDKVLERACKLLEQVGLNPEDVLYKYPHQLSGGMKQRVAIARALAVNPEFIIADEIVSALDVSVKAQILNLLVELQEEYRLTYLFISHDLPTVMYISDRVAVMYLGKIMEILPAKRLFEEALHPYTHALLSSMPSLYLSDSRPKVRLRGEIPSPISPPPGCRLSTRCPYATDICKLKEPEMRKVGREHYVACHLY